MDEEQLATVTQCCAEDALAFWAIDLEALQFVVARENAVFKVEARDGRAFALRIHRHGYHSIAELESEIEWTVALREAGIDTPKPVMTRTGTAYATVPFGVSGETRQVGMIEWIDGTSFETALEAAADPTTIFQQLGALMARMHSQATTWTPSAGFVRHALDANGLIGESAWWGQFWDLPELDPDQTATILSARSRMYRLLYDYGMSRETYSLIHADLLPQNVLVYQGRPFVIDFDDAAYGWHVYDMAVALVTGFESPVFGPRRDALVAGYRSVRTFSDDDLALLPMFLTIRELVQVGWLHTRVPRALLFSSGEKLSRSELMLPRIERAVRGCQRILEQ